MKIEETLTFGQQVFKFKLPDAKSGCKYIEPENMDELVELLHNEAKVI